MITVPPYLKKGDTIGIVCPSGYMSYEKAETCIQVLKQWGYKVKVGKTLGNQFNYFSGTDEERLEDLQNMPDDIQVKAILCGRGGYGLTRIIDQLSFKKFKRNPKWVIGYSDITLLHCHLYTRIKTASVHSPMAAAFNDEKYNHEYIKSLKKVLSGKKSNYKCEPHEYNNNGSATGTLIGGNLALLAHIIGTPSEIKTAGKILFIEDIGEYIYSIDRMFYQLKRSGKLDNLAGLIIGSFSDMKDTTIPFGKNIYEVIYDITKQYNYPIIFNFPVGHTDENFALKVGCEYALAVSQNKVTLRER